jgi:DNA-binding GntR family transcriptional regulator
MNTGGTSPFRGTTLAEQVFEWLAPRIISGELAPGTEIMETALAKQLGVSRSPVREALRALASEGLVVAVPRRGVYVSLLDAKDAKDLYECRSMLEGLCVRLTAPGLSPAALSSLACKLDQMRAACRARDCQEYARLNGDFHVELYSFCPNSTVKELISHLWRRTMRYRGFLTRHRPDRLEWSLELHERLVSCLELRDSTGAEGVTREIIESAWEALALLVAKEDGCAQRPQITQNGRH